MKPTFFVFLLTLCFITNEAAFAQQPTYQVSGRVADTAGEPLPGAAVSIEGKGAGAVTAADGTYTLTLHRTGTYTLTASYIGYESQQKKFVAGRDKKLNFTLSENAFDLGTVVVTGTRTPKLLKDAPIITRVITADDIRKVDATNVGQLLQTELPGIEFSYSMDQQVSINMQGFGGNSVLFLVDGERLAGETLNNVDYNRLNLDNVERVEIVKGAASTLYGSSAIGGVVNIITRESQEPWQLSLNSRLGEHSDQRYGGTVGFKSGRFNSQTNVQHTHMDSYNVPNGDYTTVYGNQSWNFKEQLTYRPSEAIKLTARAGYYFRERDKLGDSKDRYRDFSGGAKMNYDLNTLSNLEVAYTFDQYDKSDYLNLYQSDVRDYSNVQHGVRTLYNHTFGDKNTLTVGAEYMRDYLLSYQFANNGSYTMHSADAFAQFDWNPTEHFNVIGGLRYDYFSESDVQRLSPHLGLMYKISKCSLRASYSQGFRSPTLKEMYMNFDMANAMMIYGNPDLKSETSHNFSLSAEYTKSRYNFSATGYYNLVNNRIDLASFRDADGRWAQLYTNTEKVDIAGIDLNASAKYPCGLGLRLSYGYIHEFMRDNQVRLSATRPHSATARIEYGKSWKSYNFNLSLDGRALSKVETNKYTGNNPDEGIEPVSYPGYTMWNLILTQGVWKGINLNMAVNNLFNYVPGYYDANSPYTTGTNFSIGLSLDVDRFFRK